MSNMVGERLKLAMNWARIDQAGLARAVGSTQGAISKILVGKTRNSRLMPRIATRLHVELPWLLGMQDDPGREDVEVVILPEEHEWLGMLRKLESPDRDALLTLARSLTNMGHAPGQELQGEQPQR